jgi:hypothetical protein
MNTGRYDLPTKRGRLSDGLPSSSDVNVSIHNFDLYFVSILALFQETFRRFSHGITSFVAYASRPFPGSPVIIVNTRQRRPSRKSKVLPRHLQKIVKNAEFQMLSFCF